MAISTVTTETRALACGNSQAQTLPSGRRTVVPVAPAALTCTPGGMFRPRIAMIPGTTASARVMVIASELVRRIRDALPGFPSKAPSPGPHSTTCHR